MAGLRDMGMSGKSILLTILEMFRNCIVSLVIMLLVPETTPIPLTTDAFGVVRVAGTRITLDTVVETFLDGATAEAIQEQYPSLDLSDIYGVISYYLRHQQEVDHDRQVRQVAAAEKRQVAEAQFSPIGIRDRLLARRKTLA
jgi:uncharacterized protein (DUF433 family)